MDFSELGPLGRDLLSKKLLFVTGKGGVGKSTVAGALGRITSKLGAKTLICEVDAKGDIGRLFGVDDVAFTPTQVAPNLFLMAMNTEDALAEYLRLNLRIPLITTLGPLAKAFDFVANAAPGVKEILVVGKLCYEVRERNYDVVIVDASASGHIVSQLSSPEGISELFQFGLVKEQTRWMSEILSNHSDTSVVVVSTPEETPVNESLELIARLKNETSLGISAAIINRVMEEPFTGNDRAIYEEVVAEVASGESEIPSEVVETSQLALGLREVRAIESRRLVNNLPDGVASIFVPYFFDIFEPSALSIEVADSLLGEFS